MTYILCFQQTAENEFYFFWLNFMFLKCKSDNVFPIIMKRIKLNNAQKVFNTILCERKCAINNYGCYCCFPILLEKNLKVFE